MIIPNFSDGVRITVNSDGGDGYYPSGYIGVSDPEYNLEQLIMNQKMKVINKIWLIY